jgi:hypothetical protein
MYLRAGFLKALRQLSSIPNFEAAPPGDRDSVTQRGVIVI